MRPYSLFLVFITQQSGKYVCVSKEEERETETIGVGMCAVLGVRVCDFGVCVYMWGEGISTAATSSDSGVTVRLGLCRQCG